MSRFNGKVSYLCIVIANKQDGSSTLSLIIGRARLYHIISYFFGDSHSNGHECIYQSWLTELANGFWPTVQSTFIRIQLRKYNDQS